VQSHLDRLPATQSEAFDPALVPDDDVGAVVIGFNQFFNYRLLAYAHHVLFRKPDNLFIATNLDPQLPQKDRLWPGGGALVASLRVRLINACLCLLLLLLLLTSFPAPRTVLN
jgi:ribonucleotide monophosphatase NagD (HAD superfamily)